MAIRLVTGVPGSGKTYLAVDHLVKNYFNYDKNIDEYVKKDNKIQIITNIEGFLLDHLNIDQILKDAQIPFEIFFSKDYQEKIHKKYPQIIYIIDECQQYFHRKFYNKDVSYYFEYHRHFGDDIYLITQDKRKLSLDIGILAEFEIRAVKRSFSLMGEFKYNVISDGIIADRKILKPNKKIFALYTSAFANEKEKIKKPWLIYIGIPLILLPIAIFALYNHLIPSEGELEKRQLHIKNNVNQNLENLNNGTKTSQKRQNDNNVDTKIRINGFIWQGQKLLILDPKYNEMINANHFPYQLKFEGIRCLYAIVPKYYADSLPGMSSVSTDDQSQARFNANVSAFAQGGAERRPFP
jgi:hypothetical protein